MGGTPHDRLVEELMTASRALVGVALRSIAAAPVGVTVAQHRLLVLVAAHGPRSVGEIAEHLGVNPSNASRHCDRLQRLGLLRRRRSEDDARVVRVELTPAGRAVVDAVTRHRRAEFAELAARLPDDETASVAAALQTLTVALGEIADADWIGSNGSAPHVPTT